MNTLDNKLEQLGEILKKARIEKGYSTRKLAELSQVASNAEISMLENAKRLKPDPIMLKAIAKILDLNYIELFQLIGYIDKDIPESFNKISAPADQEIKIYGSISFHNGEFVCEQYLKTVYLSYPGENCVGFIVTGDSMEPRIPDSSIVIIDRDIKEFEHRNVAAFLVDGKFYIRRVVKQNNKEYLISDNPNYDPIFMDQNNEVLVIGKVIKLLVEKFI